MAKTCNSHSFRRYCVKISVSYRFTVNSSTSWNMTLLTIFPISGLFLKKLYGNFKFSHKTWYDLNFRPVCVKISELDFFSFERSYGKLELIIPSSFTKWKDLIIPQKKNLASQMYALTLIFLELLTFANNLSILDILWVFGWLYTRLRRMIHCVRSVNHALIINKSSMNHAWIMLLDDASSKVSREAISWRTKNI